MNNRSETNMATQTHYTYTLHPAFMVVPVVFVFVLLGFMLLA